MAPVEEGLEKLGPDNSGVEEFSSVITVDDVSRDRVIVKLTDSDAVELGRICESEQDRIADEVCDLG